MTARRQLVAGAWLVAAYVLAALATSTWAPGGMRPLFDGFGSHPGQYNWVEPPKEFAEGNQAPEKAEAGIVLSGADGSGPASASPPDGQVLATVVPKAVPAHPPDEAATLDLRPVDAGSLAPLPVGLRPEGNAYRIAVTYRPSDTVLEKLEVPGTLGLTSAAPADVLLFSADGTSWERRPATPLAQGNGLTGVLVDTGFYLAASEGPLREAAGGGGGAPVVLYALAAVVPVALAWLLLGKRSRSGAPAGGRKAPPRKGSGAGAGKPSSRRPPGGKRPQQRPPGRR